jgi:hypothetical protein
MINFGICAIKEKRKFEEYFGKKKFRAQKKENLGPREKKIGAQKKENLGPESTFHYHQLKITDYLLNFLLEFLFESVNEIE